MAISNQMFTWTIAAGEDMDNSTAGTGFIHKAVSNVDGTIANATKPTTAKSAIGLVQYGGLSGEHVTIGHAGIMKFTAGAAINSADVMLTVTTSGYLTIATSGDFYIGRFLEGTNGTKTVTSGGVGVGLFNFATPVLLVE